MTSGSARRIWGILKKVKVEKWAPNEKGWLSFARRGLGQVLHEMGGCRWKSQNRKKVYLSPYVKEPLNSKVIKSFVPELRSRYVFFGFWDSYVLSLWTFDVCFTHSHIMAMVHSDCNSVNCFYLKVLENFMHFIFLDRFWCTNFHYGLIFISCTILSGLPFSPSHA